MPHPPKDNSAAGAGEVLRLTRFTPYTTSALLLIALTGLLPQSAAAVTVAECLEQSHSQTAVQSCQALLDQDNRSPAIYLRLAKALNATGRRAESFQAIESGLQTYPDNAELKELRTIVRSNLSEQEYLDAQANKGPSVRATNNAKLRILRIKCLKKDGKEALDACEEFVSLGGSDAEVSQKQASLLASLPSESPVPTPAPLASDNDSTKSKAAPPTPEDTPKAAKVIDLTPATPPAASNQATNRASKDREAYERQLALVKEIQTALNDLGYPAGLPDGLPGAKTNRAIEQFYADTRLGPAQPVGKDLLADLERAQTLRQDTQVLLRDSRNALARGDTVTARALLEQAQTLASWVAAKDNLAQRIAEAEASAHAAGQLEQARQQAVASVDAMLRAGDLEAAEQSLADALTRFSNDSQLQTLSDRLAELRDNQAREQAAKLAQQSREKAIAESLARAQSLHQRGDFDAALAELAATSKLAPEQPSIAPLRARIEADREQQRQAAAEEARQQAARQRASALLDRAQSALDGDVLDDVGELLTQAKSADPTIDTTAIESQLSEALAKREQRAREEQQRQLAAQQRQQQIKSLEQLASMALDQGDAVRARALIDEASAIDPDYANETLQQRLKQQVQLDRLREESDAVLQQARDALSSDDIDRATALARRAGELDPDYDDVALVVAQITRRQRELESEKLAAKTAATRQAELAATISTLLDNAKSEGDAGNSTAAKAIAEEILLLQPENQAAQQILAGSDESDGGDAEQLRLVELLERGEALLSERRSRESDRGDYFNQALPASIGRLFGE